jgi:hypothetical protein
MWGFEEGDARECPARMGVSSKFKSKIRGEVLGPRR